MTEPAQDDGKITAPVPRPILGWAFLAILVAAAITAGIAILLGDETATLEDYRTRGAEYADSLDIFLMLAICAAVSLAVWTAFQVFIFGKRAKLWKSIIALVSMLLVVTLAGFTARAVTLTSYIEADRAALREIRTSLNQHLLELRTEADEANNALRADRGLPRMRTEAEIREALAAIRAQRDRIRGFEVAADEAIHDAREEMLALDVYEGDRVAFIEQIDEILAPDSATHRLFDLETALLDKQEEALTLLLDRRSSWSFYQGQIQFHDQAALHRMNEIMGEAYEIIRQIDILEGAGGEGVPRASAEPIAPAP